MPSIISFSISVIPNPSQSQDHWLLILVVVVSFFFDLSIFFAVYSYMLAFPIGNFIFLVIFPIFCNKFSPNYCNFFIEIIVKTI